MIPAVASPRPCAPGDQFYASQSIARNLLIKLINDPKSSDATIKIKMHELADIQADLQLAGVFADRARNKVYTAEQKAIVSKSSGCGCGSGAGGCGG